MTATDLRDPFAISDPEDDEPTTELPPEIADAKPWRLPESSGAKLTAEQMAERGPDYPYGRRADGTPRAKPGQKATGTPRMAAAPRPRKTARPAAKSAGPDYRAGIMGLLQIPIMGLAMVGRQTKNPALQADGYALAMHAPALAEALNETAKAQPAVGRALESIMKAGPYGAIIGAMVPLVMQVAANHKLMNPAPAMGIHDPADLAAASDAQLAAMVGAQGGE
jgi:hypothetical protein